MALTSPLPRNSLETLLDGPHGALLGTRFRFAGPADRLAFETWLLASGYRDSEVPDIARIVCEGLRGDDSLVLHKDGEDAWAAYLEETTHG